MFAPSSQGRRGTGKGDEPKVGYTLCFFLGAAFILIGELNVRLAERGIQLEVSQEVKQWLITEGFEPQYGARPMRRTIQKRLGDPLSEELIRGKFKDAKKIKVVMSEEEPTFVEEEVLAGV